MKKVIIETRKGNVLYLHFPTKSILKVDKVEIEEKLKDFMGIVITSPSHERLSGRHMQIVKTATRIAKSTGKHIKTILTQHKHAINVNGVVYHTYMLINEDVFKDITCELTEGVLQVLEEEQGVTDVSPFE
jgi:hypothetical protein